MARAGKQRKAKTTDWLEKLIGAVGGVAPTAALAALRQNAASTGPVSASLAKLERRAVNKGRKTPNRENVKTLMKEKVPRLLEQTEGITKLLGQYVDPATHKPVRLPDVSSASCVGTAISTLFVADTLNWTSVIPAIADCPAVGFDHDNPEPILSDPSQRLVAAFRDPVVMGIVSAGPWATSSPSVYRYDVPVSSVTNRPVVQWKEDFELALGQFMYVSGPLRYGDFMVPGLVLAGERQVVWIDASEAQPALIQTKFQFANSAGAYLNTTFSCVQWNDENESEVFEQEKQTIAAGNTFWTHSVTVRRSAYYSFLLNLDNYQQAEQALFLEYYTMTVTVKTALSFDHIIHPSVLDAMASDKGKEIIGQARVLGQGVLISNSTAEMFKAGTIYSKQIDAKAPWYRDVQSPEDFSTTNVAASYDGPMSKGLFAIVKPQGPQAFDLLEVVDSNEAGSERFCFRPFVGCGQVVTLLAPGTVNTTAGAPNTSVVIHWARGFEFTTQNQLFLVDVSKVKRVDMLTFMDELSKFPQFFENPLHLKDISALMKRAGSWAWDNKATILEVGKLLAALSKAAA